jgi:hypothetical protein
MNFRAHEVDPDARQERRHVVGELRWPGGEFADVRIVEVDRAQLFESRARAVEHLDHLVGCDSSRQGCREQSARGNPEVHIEFGDFSADQKIVQGLEATDFERTTRNGAASQDQRHHRISFARPIAALSNQRQTHRATPEAIEAVEASSAFDGGIRSFSSDQRSGGEYQLENNASWLE